MAVGKQVMKAYIDQKLVAGQRIYRNLMEKKLMHYGLLNYGKAH